MKGVLGGFGLRLKKMRIRQRLTQSELAKRCGLGESTISFYESGKRNPSYEILLCLTKHLKTTPNYLLMGLNEIDRRQRGKNNSQTCIELENFIRNQPNLHIFGEPLNDDAIDDAVLALKAAWAALRYKEIAGRN